MKEILTALASGTIFGAGLALSGMTNPAKVMGSALCVSAIAVRIDSRRHHPGSASRVAAGNVAGIDAKLIAGSVLFGIGWGLAGLCPGPALASLITGSKGIFVFSAAMVIGMTIYSAWANAVAARSERALRADG